MSQSKAPAQQPDRARRASSFGAVADEYERGRPGYPREAIAWLLGPEPLEVLDLGAGTGKLTGALIEAGHRVVALEPLAEMRAILVARHPEARVLNGHAEQLPLADDSVDAVVAGAAFHWFDHDVALSEAARVMRPPGVLGLLGNGFDVSRPWVAHLREIAGSPAIQRPGHWPEPELLRERWFTDVEDREFGHGQHVDRASLRDLITSRSRLAVLDPAARGSILAEIDSLWEREPELIGRSEAVLPWFARARRCRGLR
jgi:ubiquinone/menaquinone biosynthesis C-methylase UbiE